MRYIPTAFLSTSAGSAAYVTIKSSIASSFAAVGLPVGVGVLVVGGIGIGGFFLLKHIREKRRRERVLMAAASQGDEGRTVPSAYVPGLGDCPICYREMFKMVQFLQCGHYFHPTCIANWLEGHKTCPSCRRNVAEIDDILAREYREKLKVD